MTSFNKPTIKEIYNTIINDYNTRIGESAPLLKKAVVRCFAYSIAGVISFMWNFANWQYLQIFIETCEFEALQRWGNLVNIIYKTGTNSMLQIQINNVNAIAISAGTTYKSLTNNLIYTSISNVAVANNTAILNVKCSESGSIGNLLNGETLTLINPIVGIPDNAFVISTLITGTNTEDVEDYRERIIIRYKRKPQGGSAIDYFLWATEVSGVVDCLPYILNAGMVSLYLVSNGSGLNRTPTGSLSSNPFPTWINGQMQELVGSGQFLSVAKIINGSDGTNNRRPIGVKVELLPPVYTGYKIEIQDLNPLGINIINSIKSALIMEFDKKRPNISAIGYSVNNATVNSNQLSSIVQNIINTGSFTLFQLKNSNNNVILTDILGIGCLAYLSELKINGAIINL